MFRKFSEIEKFVLSHIKKKRVVLANAHDKPSLAALVKAKRIGIVDGTLLGDSKLILELLSSMDEPVADYEIIHVDAGNDEAVARMAVAMVNNKQADLPMKGLMLNSSFVRAILDKSTGLLAEGSLLSAVSVLEYTKEDRMLFISDPAINIFPDFKDKVRIIQNAVKLAMQMGYSTPKVAVVTPLEIVNPKIPSTVDAQKLKEANQQGLISDCIVGGPLALDNAISLDAAKHKGITDPVAGVADILIMSDLNMGNVFVKSLLFFTEMTHVGVTVGTSVPVINTSRSDSLMNRYYGILSTLLGFNK